MRKQNKYRIILVTHDLAIGGLQRVVADIASNINMERFDLSVCALRRGGVIEEELTEQNIPVYKIPLKEGSIDYFTFWKLFNIFRHKKPHIIHTHNTQPLIEGMMAALLARVPVRIHTDHARSFPDKKRYMFAERLFSNFIDNFVAVSEYTREELIKYERIKPGKIMVIRNGIDGKKYEGNIDKEKKRRELGVNDTIDPILGLGVRLSQQKGITFLLKAVKLLKVDFPRIILLIAGDGDLLKNLKKESIELGLADNVRFLGSRLDMHEIMQVLDVYVLPSLWEGLPLVVLEAMAAKKPIVATNVGGTGEAIIHRQTGILVPPEDPYLLKEGILELLKDREFAEELAENSYRRFLEHFSVNRMVKNYEELYLSCCQSKKLL